MGSIEDQNENNLNLVTQSCKGFSVTDLQKTVLVNYGWFQRRSLVILSICQSILSFSLVTPVFIYYVPYNFCAWENQGNSSNEECTLYSVNDSCTKICDSFNFVSNFSGQSANEVTGVEKCNKWIYDLSDGETIVTKFNLVCESSWKRPVMQAIFMIGLLIGSVVGGPATDRYGRKKILLVAFILHGFGNLAMAFVPNYWMFIIALFLTGAFHIIMYNNSYVLGQEIVPDSVRSTAALYINTGFALGYLILPAVAFLAKNWFILVMCSSIASFLYLPLFWILPESPKWLHQNGKDVKLKKLCIWIAKFNNIKINQKLSKTNLDDFSSSPFKTKIQRRKSSSPSLLVKVKVLRKRIVLICFLWNVCYFGFYTTTLNTSNLGGNIYLNCFFGALVDLGSYFFMALLLLKLGRRNASLTMLFASALFCFLTPVLRGVAVLAGVVSAMCAKFFVTTAMGIIILYTGELFPTLIRNTSVGIASMSARFASAASPFLIYIGESVNASIPFYVMGGFFLLASFCSVLLPETSNAPLPDTVDDAIQLENSRIRRLRSKKEQSKIVHREDEEL